MFTNLTSAVISASFGLLVLVLTLTPARGELPTCSAYVYPGPDDVDIKLAVIQGLHRAEAGKCETRYYWEALQQVIAMYWATDLLNGDNITESFIPGVRIGIDAYDECYTEYLAGRQAGALASHIRGISDCPVCDTAALTEAPVAGVIGTSISQTTTIVANILKPTSIPVVGISATLPELGDKSKYPGFIRTVPSDLKQAKVIIELAKHFSWAYIVGIHTSDNYGTQGIEEVRKLALQEGICISLTEEFDVSSEISEARMENFARDKLYDKLLRANGSIGIVYFGRESTFLAFLRYMATPSFFWRAATLRKVYWVVTDFVNPTKELAQLIEPFGTKIVLIGPSELAISSFEDYFFESFLGNPPDWVNGQWRVAIADVVKNAYGCTGYNFTEESMRGCDIRSRAPIPSYLTASLDSVYLLANTIKSIHKETCAGQPGMCQAFTSTLQNGILKNRPLEDLDYTSIDSVYIPPEFLQSKRRLRKNDGDFEAVNATQYSMKANFNSRFQQIGKFENNTVTIFPGYETILKPSQCKAQCEVCIHMDEVKYIFSPGSFIILGLFSLHWEATDDPFECGGYREKSVSYVAMLAFLNSIEQLKLRTGLDFGYLVVDDCYNTLTANRMLSKILSGDLPIIDSDTGERFDPSSVKVAVGAQSSPVTIGSVQILQNLNISMISYSSTSSSLDSRLFYPYFSRTVSSDTVQATAILAILIELRVTFVGAIVIQNSYGLKLYKLFRAMAEEEHICVYDALEVTDKTRADDVKPMLNTYRQKSIQVIVVIAMDKVASTILEAAEKSDSFVFIASEAWGPNPDILKGDGGERARGSLVLGASVSVQLDYGLKEYLQTIDPFGKESNTWLREFWQDQFKCDLPGGFNNVRQNVCLQRYKNVSDSWVNAPLSVHSTMATISAGLAINSLKNDKRKLEDPAEITIAIREVVLNSSSGIKFRPFLDSGNGNCNYQIYNVQKDERGNYVYVDVGKYLNSGGLNIDRSKVKFYDILGAVTNTVTSECSIFYEECQQVCVANPTGDSTDNATPAPDNPVPRTSGANDSSSDAAVIALSVLCGLLILVALVVALVVILIRMGKISFRKDRKYTNPISTGFGSNPSSNSWTSAGNKTETSGGSSGDGHPDAPPALPNRKAPAKPPVNEYKAHSDVVVTSSDLDTAVAHDVVKHSRSMSLPSGSDNATEHNISDNLPFSDTGIDARAKPTPHVPLPNVSDETQENTHIQPQESEECGQVLHNMKPIQQVQPLTVNPSFYLGEIDDSSYPPDARALSGDQNQLPGSGPHSDDLFPATENNSYQNVTSPLDHVPVNPADPIIFQNVSGNSMVYHIASPTEAQPKARSPQSIPNHSVPIATSEGIIAVPYETFLAWQNHGLIAYPKQQNHPANNTEANTTDTAPAIAYPKQQNHSAFNTETNTIDTNPAPAPCKPLLGSKDYITPINVAYVGPKQPPRISDHDINAQSHSPRRDDLSSPTHVDEGGHPQRVPYLAPGHLNQMANMSNDSPMQQPDAQSLMPHPRVLHTIQSYPTNLASPNNATVPPQPLPSHRSAPVIFMQPPSQAVHPGEAIRPTSLKFLPGTSLNKQLPPQQSISTDKQNAHQLRTTPEQQTSPRRNPAESQREDIGQLTPQRQSPQQSDGNKAIFMKRPTKQIQLAQRPRHSDIMEESSGAYEADV